MLNCSFYEIYNEKIIITYNNNEIFFIEINDNLEYKIIYQKNITENLVQILKINISNYILFNFSNYITCESFENNELKMIFILNIKISCRFPKIIELNNSNLAILNSKEGSIDIYNKFRKDDFLNYIHTTHLCTNFLDIFFIKSTNDIIGKERENENNNLLFINTKEYKYGKKLNIRRNYYFDIIEDRVNINLLSQFELLKDDILGVCNVSSPLLLIDLKTYDIISYVNRNGGGGYLYYSSILYNTINYCYGIAYTRYCSSGLVFTFQEFCVYENKEYDEEFFKTFQIGKISLEETKNYLTLDEFPINLKYFGNNVFLIFMKNNKLKLFNIIK